MSKQPQPLLQRVLVPATSRLVLTPQVVLGVTAVAVVLHLTGSVDIGTRALALRAALAAITSVGSFALIAVANAIPAASARSRVIIMLTSYIGAGLFRGLTLSAALDLSGFTPGGGWQYRLPFGVVSTTATTILVTFAWTTYAEHLEAASLLRAETGTLREALERIAQQSDSDARSQIASISQTLVAELREIAMHPVDAQERAIQAILDERIRPLNRELAAQIQRWAPTASDEQPLKAREVWATTDLARSLPHPSLALLIASASVPSAIYLFGWQEALELAVLAGATLYGSIRAVSPLLRRWLTGKASPAREIIATLVFELVALPVVAASYAVLVGTGKPTAYFVSLLVSYPIYAWLMMLGQVFWNEAKRQEQQLQSTRSELRWAICRANLMAWYNGGVVARMLHGPIQNSMHAAVLRLHGRPAESVVSGVITELQQRIAELDSVSEAGTSAAIDVERELSQVRELWTGLADIDVTVTPAARHTLAVDAPAANIVMDLCREATSNAIRHGRATAVAVRMDAAVRRLSVRVEHNGYARTGASGAGVGSQFLDTCSLEWSFGVDQQRNYLVAVIPTMPLDAHS